MTHLQKSQFSPHLGVIFVVLASSNTNVRRMAYLHYQPLKLLRGSETCLAFGCVLRGMYKSDFCKLSLQTRGSGQTPTSAQRPPAQKTGPTARHVKCERDITMRQPLTRPHQTTRPPVHATMRSLPQPSHNRPASRVRTVR